MTAASVEVPRKLTTISCLASSRVTKPYVPVPESENCKFWLKVWRVAFYKHVLTSPISFVPRGFEQVNEEWYAEDAYLSTDWWEMAREDDIEWRCILEVLDKIRVQRYWKLWDDICIFRNFMREHTVANCCRSVAYENRNSHELEDGEMHLLDEVNVDGMEVQGGLVWPRPLQKFVSRSLDPCGGGVTRNFFSNDIEARNKQK